VDFLRGRGVPLTEKPAPTLSPLPSGKPGHEAILESMRQVATTDREVLEGGSRAFMSFLKAYKEHLLSYIFQFDHLDIGAVARGYALLRLPKIPETRGERAKSIVFESTPIDTSTIPYKHKEKEAARQRRLAEYKAEKMKESELQQESDEEGGDDSDVDGSIVDRRSVVSVTGKKAWVPPEQYVPQEEKRIRKKKKSGCVITTCDCTCSVSEAWKHVVQIRFFFGVLFTSYSFSFIWNVLFQL
jgi:hypothetical protein